MHTKKETEIWIGNHILNKPMRPCLKSLKTIRLGEQAYDYYGKKLSPDHILPCFIDKTEVKLYSDLMTEECRRIRGFINR